MNAVSSLYSQIVDKNLLVRRAAISANHVICEELIEERASFEQLDLFTDYAALEKQKAQEKAVLEREHEMQKAIFDIKKSLVKTLS